MSGSVDGIPVSALIAEGLLAHPSAIAEVIERTGVVGSPDPSRVLVGRVLGGFEHEVVASRGLDIGYISWRGVPLAWRSPVQDARSLDSVVGSKWLSRFTGGLLTTCGPFNVGPAHGEEGLHGDFSHRPAGRVTAWIDHGATHITGVIESQNLFGPSLTIERTIVTTADTDSARLTITDDVHNPGPIDTNVALLYHLNFGAPLVVPGTTVTIDAQGWTAREPVASVPDPSVLPPACAQIVEAVFEYQTVKVDCDGWSHAIIRRPESRLVVEIAWKSAGLPYLYQWIFPTRGRWALAIEPASAPLFGDARNDPMHGAPVLPPGQHRHHEIIITIREAVA
jgi:galactose mutarotase-like enzyme